MDRSQKANEKSTDFFDKDIHTDKHDEIMIWLDSNVHSLLSRKGQKVLEKTWEQPIIRGHQQYKTIVGYADMRVFAEGPDPLDSQYSKRFAYIFEVKSKIKNIGEVIRQIRQYQTFVRDYIFVVVCPDDKFAGILRDQGIGFIKCP